MEKLTFEEYNRHMQNQSTVTNLRKTEDTDEYVVFLLLCFILIQQPLYKHLGNSIVERLLTHTDLGYYVSWIELIFLEVHTMLCLGFLMKILVITQQCFCCCRTVCTGEGSFCSSCCPGSEEAGGVPGAVSGCLLGLNHATMIM